MSKEAQMKINYRKMEEADLTQVIQLGNITEGFEVGENSGFWDETTLRDWITKSDDPLIVAEIETEIAGFILGAVHHPTKKVTLENIVVAESYRKQRVATGLLTAFMREVELQDLKYICALSKVTNIGAISFFEKSGFKRGEDFSWLYINKYDK